MNLWRNSLGGDMDSSYGYKWFTSKADALQHVEDNPELYNWHFAKIAQVFNFDGRNKKSIVEFLNSNAAYADNG